MVSELLSRHDSWRGCLFVLSPAGPRGWPLIFRVIDDELWSTTYLRAVKVPVLEASSTGTVLLFEHEDDLGPYLVIEGALSVEVPTDELMERWLSDGIDESSRVVDRLRRAKRGFIRVRCDRVEAFGA